MDFLDNIKESFFMKVLIAMLTFLFSLATNAQIDEIPKYKPVDIELHNEIVKMDSEYFTAYNNCDMKTQATIYDTDIEFFHDKGGFSNSKEDLLKALKENICGKVTRTLIKGSIEVYPIHNYGAIEIGYHKFFNNKEPNAKSIPSKFIITWKKKGAEWKITKVISLH